MKERIANHEEALKALLGKPIGMHELGKFKGYRFGKGALVAPNPNTSIDEWEKWGAIVAYPEKEHSFLFSMASIGSGPGMFHHAGIFSIFVEPMPFSKLIKVPTIQYHVEISTKKSPKRKGIPGEIIREYSELMPHALVALVALAQKTKMNVLIKKGAIHPVVEKYAQLERRYKPGFEKQIINTPKEYRILHQVLPEGDIKITPPNHQIEQFMFGKPKKRVN